MARIHKFFLVVEGINEGYPNYGNAKVHFCLEDISQVQFQNLFICSPLFSLEEKGAEKMPLIVNGTQICFFMIPNVFPTFGNLIAEFNLQDEGWRWGHLQIVLLNILALLLKLSNGPACNDSEGGCKAYNDCRQKDNDN